MRFDAILGYPVLRDLISPGFSIDDFTIFHIQTSEAAVSIS
jgi:hypothetical protein